MAAVAAPAAGAAVASKATVTTYATIASAAISAIGAIQSGRAAQAQADTQAAIDRQRADREREAAGIEADEFRRDQHRLMARRRAELGATGVEPGEGSPLLVSEDFAAESELQALRLRAGGETRATRLEQGASLTQASGRQAKRAGFTRGGALLLSGVGTAFGRQAKRAGTAFGRD